MNCNFENNMAQINGDLAARGSKPKAGTRVGYLSDFQPIDMLYNFFYSFIGSCLKKTNICYDVAAYEIY